MISLDFSSVLTWPRVRLFCVAQALTRCMSLVPRRIIGPSSRLAIGHHLKGSNSAMAWVQDTKLFCNCTGSRRANTSPRVSWDGIGAIPGRSETRPAPLAEEFYVDPGIGAADGGTNGNGNDVHQLMASGAFHPWVVQVSEMIENAMPHCLHLVQRIMAR